MSTPHPTPPTEPGRGVRSRPWRVVGVGVGLVAVGLVAVALAAQPWNSAPIVVSSSPGAPTADPSRYDADGVPFEIDGEPVLRGEAIAARASAGNDVAFLVAGWEAIEPVPSCMPSAIRCGSHSLVDAPGAQADAKVTVEDPTGYEHQYDWLAAWAGGFHVLRVHTGCTWYGSTCLVVDDEIRPAAALPSSATGYGEDGVPLLVDGQPVHRGVAIEPALSGAWDVQPVWLAGRVVSTGEGGAGCDDPATWEAHPCPAVTIADPDRGLWEAAGIRLEAARWGLQEAWAPGSAWPDSSLVLLARGSSLLGWARPPGVEAVATMAPVPSIYASSWSYRDRRVMDMGERKVLSGVQIARHVATGPTEPFLVTGTIRETNCPACAGNQAAELLPPSVVDPAASTAPGYVLVHPDGSPFLPGDAMVWSDPDGIVVLEVRPSSAACPGSSACEGALEVIGAVVPTP